MTFRAGGLRRLELFEQSGGVARLVLLPGAGDGHVACGNVSGDDGAGRGHRAVADFHGSDKHRVRADEDAGADLGAVLGDAVVVAGNGTRADVGAVAHRRVADVGQVVDLGAFADLGVLDLHEVADVGVVRELRAGAEAGEGADDSCLLCDENSERAQLAA